MEIPPAAVRAFQRFSGLNQTGLIDEVTWQKMREPRCGNKDLRRIQRRKRFILQGTFDAENHLRSSMLFSRHREPLAVQ